MKKFISFALCFCLVFVSIFMCACDNDQSFWETTFQNTCQILEQDQKYAFVLDKEQLERSQSIKDQMALSDTYNQLEQVYDFCFYQAIDFLKSYYPGLQVKPLNLDNGNTKKIKKQFEQFDKQLQLFKDSCNDFLQANIVFNTTTENQNLSDVYALQKLKEYKAEYHKLINNTLDLCNTLASLYEIGYLDLENDLNQTTNAKFSNNKLCLQVLDLFSKIQLDIFDGISDQMYANDIKSLVISLWQNNQKQLASDINFKQWQNQNNLFENDFSNAMSALDNFDAKDFVCNCNSDLSTYLSKHNQSSNTYAQIYHNFSTVTLEYFANLTTQMFA